MIGAMWLMFTALTSAAWCRVSGRRDIGARSRLKFYSYPEDVRAAAAKASADMRAATRSRVEATKASGGF
jgi:head-tail adaptor